MGLRGRKNVGVDKTLPKSSTLTAVDANRGAIKDAFADVLGLGIVKGDAAGEGFCCAKTLKEL